MNLQHGPSLQLNLHANVVEILQSFVRTRIDLLKLKSHIIHVLKCVLYYRGIKSNSFFSVNKRLKKIAPPFHWSASLKARLNAPTLILIIYCPLRVRITRAWCLRAAVRKYRLGGCKMKKSKIPKLCQNIGLGKLFLEK